MANPKLFFWIRHIRNALAGIGGLFLTNAALAANSYGPAINFRTWADATTVEDLVRFAACWLTRVGFLILILFIALVAIRMATSGSNATKFSNAFKAFGNVLIGGLVLLGTGVIIATIANIIGVSIGLTRIC